MPKNRLNLMTCDPIKTGREAAFLAVGPDVITCLTVVDLLRICKKEG